VLGILRDALRGLTARPGRTVSQGLGVALGAGLFVLALGLGQTLSAQVDDRFRLIDATTVSVTPADEALSVGADLDSFVAADRRDAARGIAGVTGIARYQVLEQQSLSAGRVPSLPPDTTATADVMIADPQLLDVIEARVRGHRLSTVDERVPRQVALLGRALAEELGIEQPGAQVHVGRLSVHVIGIIDDAERLPQTLRSLVVGPLVVGHPDAGSSQASRWHPATLVTTRPGAAQVVASNLALMLRPTDPDTVRVAAPLSPSQLRRSVSGDVRLISLGGAVAVLIAGVFAVGNLMLLSITQRIPEIGMRRALGATTPQIVGMVLTEALLVGLIAGTLGSVLGLWSVLGVSIWQRWSPVLDVATAWIGITAGCAGGVLGGLLPALVAARVQPARALRH
jgi:putative ABC transport system permease protein